MRFCIAVLLSSGLLALGQTAKAPPTLKSILLEQLHSTHDKSEWFVCAKVAVDGVTPEQANWKDKSGNHSIKELADHLIFWDERSLEKFKGGQVPNFTGKNEETFHAPETWEATVKKLDSEMTDWENAVEAANDAMLAKWYSTIAHIGTHRAYHLGQIVYIRREQGSWNPEKGVQ